MLLLQGRILPPPPKKKMTLCVIGHVRFEGGKMYIRHHFPCGRLKLAYVCFEKSTADGALEIL